MSEDKKPKQDVPAPAPQAGVGSGATPPLIPGQPTPAGAPAAGTAAAVIATPKPAAPAGPPAPGAPPAPAIVLPKAPDGQMTLRVNGKDHFIDPKKHPS